MYKKPYCIPLCLSETPARKQADERANRLSRRYSPRTAREWQCEIVCNLSIRERLLALHETVFYAWRRRTELENEVRWQHAIHVHNTVCDKHTAWRLFARLGRNRLS